MKKSILVVDDELGIREALTIILEKFSFEVSSAASGHEAIEKINSQKFDLIITDFKMAGLSGADVIRYAKQYGIRTILISALDAKNKANSVGADGFLEKPFGSKELKILVEALLEKGGEKNE